MATVISSSVFSPTNFLSFPLSQRSLELNPHPARRNLCCSGKKYSKGRAAKSDEELCDELREFIESMGLPEDHLPSISELRDNGRKDLANIVRRRGYKAITELLLNSNSVNHFDKTSEGNKDGKGCAFNRDFPSEAIEGDNLNDINHLKSLLCQKETELSQLKKQIEDEKFALVNLRARVKAELGDIQCSIADKDAELRAAQEYLNGLKEVHINYRTNGQVVEVAGSFNGWQHKVRMDLDHSSECIDSPDSRKPELWSTVLWLYPGIYEVTEIKFIVDGHWTVDPGQEIIISGGFTNNVLTVDG
ncbi:protein PTST homolog 3, chloroplastic-like isoform X2 [Zingiber officinale]|uniref:protein PTST homolog 3, chloroplastic-like isoform X2 n=1 Tax=Zingiber officinale TaxID=94328 RepID=UPI001C4C1B79|nr:protein PTST homolog 3, chloroplastic-like isoform X2 [Zingiber officinale]